MTATPWMAALLLGGLMAAASTTAAQTPTYRLLAGAESDDAVALIAFTPCGEGRSAACGARVVRTYVVGLYPGDVEGPHGVVAAADGKSFFVTIAHGRPFGLLQHYDLESGKLLGQARLGMFPATVDISPSGALLYVINFNFEDPEMAPSSLSVVDGATMIEVARPTTCRMPHGSRLSPDGSRHYSGCMMNDLLVEVDTRSMSVSRLFNVAPGKEGPVAVTSHESQVASHGHEEQEGAAGVHDHLAMSSDCSPTWAQPSADGSRVYVACNKSNEIVEVDVAGWRMLRRWPTPKTPYNLAATPDGRLLIATQKGPGTTTIWRLEDAKLLAEVPGTRKVASGVAVSRDARYAFVTLEGIGGEPGTIDVIDLGKLSKVASVEIGKQAGGIALVPDGR